MCTFVNQSFVLTTFHITFDIPHSRSEFVMTFCQFSPAFLVTVQIAQSVERIKRNVVMKAQDFP